MLQNNLLALLTSKDKQLSVLSQTSSRDKLSSGHPNGKKESLPNDSKRQNRSSFSLAPNGMTAQLCIPDDERAPLLVSDLKLVLYRVLDPQYFDNSKTYWFKIQGFKNITSACLVIVDGITVSTLRNLNLGTKEMRRLHRKRLRKGLILPYLGNYDQDEVLDCPLIDNSDSSFSYKTHESKPQMVAKDNDSCEGPPQKRFKQSMLEVLNGLQTWLPQTSSLLPSRVEVVSPALYGNSAVLDFFLLPLSSDKKSSIKFSYLRRPETLRLLDSDMALYKKARGETIDSYVSPASTGFQQLVPQELDLAINQTGSNVMYYSQLAKRWDKSSSSAHTSSIYWGKGTTPDDVKSLKPDKMDRTCLLMNLDDMLFNNCPIHPKVHCKFTSANCHDGKDYSEFVGTKASYRPVRADSPLFAIDCEFYRKCVDMISIVNECGQKVYMTYVAEIGHHESCRQRVCSRCTRPSLHDVQQQLIQHLPPDAILVGHSISADLLALRMYHPYIIDTALHFDFKLDNLKPSLAALAKHFLGKAIQLDKFERHDPTEDALASLELVQLKLQYGFTFGCKSLGGFVPNLFTSRTDVDQVHYWHWFEHLHDSSNCSGIRTRVRLLAEKRFRDEWLSSLNGVKGLSPTLLSDGGAVMEKACTNLEDYDLSVVHIKADEKINSDETSDRLDALAALDAQLARLYDALPDKGMLTVLFVDSCDTYPRDTVQNGIFMVGVKGDEQLISKSA